VAQEAKVTASAAAAREAAAEAEAAAAAAAMPRRARGKKSPIISNPMSKGRAARREAGGGPQ
jgi:hypothetical protein